MRGAGISADEALARLLDGNKRYTGGKPAHPHQTAARRTEIAKGQAPFAAILGCSDSRAAVEVIFDQGLGDLFVVRVAGNIADEAGLGSLEYGVGVLRVPLVMVLGHSRCGAVEAAVKGTEVPGHIAALVRAITPAVDSVKGKPGDALDNAVRANAAMTVERLKGTKPVLAEAVEKGALKIVGGRYDLDTGAVEIIA